MNWSAAAMAGSEGMWPDGFTSAVSITLDNMGEAAELYRGTWPRDRTVGEHFSVTESIPRVLDLFEELGVRATYFIEGWNVETYPHVIQEIEHRGHEVGFHGWQHEPWSSLDPESERKAICRNQRVFEEIGITIKGFRPPGGLLTECTLDLLLASGMRYCSPAGEQAALVNEVAVLPFDWRGIDAYHYSEGFAPLRKIKGDPAKPLTPAHFRDTVHTILEGRRKSGGYVALLFHPFLETDPDRFNAMHEIIEMVTSQSSIWCAPCGEIAEWMLSNRQRFSDDAILDLTTWSR